jgi:hypothetical protein
LRPRQAVRCNLPKKNREDFRCHPSCGTAAVIVIPLFHTICKKKSNIFENGQSLRFVRPNYRQLGGFVV